MPTRTPRTPLVTPITYPRGGDYRPSERIADINTLSERLPEPSVVTVRAELRDGQVEADLGPAVAAVLRAKPVDEATARSFLLRQLLEPSAARFAAGERRHRACVLGAWVEVELVG